jgi:hypothetical protein
MQIESLKVFCDLAETESFTKAAQINSVTQSAVSQQISALERAVQIAPHRTQQEKIPPHARRPGALRIQQADHPDL